MTSLPLGYSMPAEWETHSATWLTWPHNENSWPGKLDKIPSVYVSWIRYLVEGENVHLNVNDSVMEAEAKALLKKGGVDLSRVSFHHFPTNDSWMRDCGPIFVKKTMGNSPESPLKLRGGDSLAITHWGFNKWGGKYPPWDLDIRIPQLIADYLQLPSYTPGIIMEGGSIEVNGQGTLMTTEACLLNKNRNPHLSQKEIEKFLSDYLGVTHFIWLGDGIVGDDTDGHIDDLARFVNPTTLVTVVEDDPQDENYKILQDNLKRLQGIKDQNGKNLTIVSLPMPGVVEYEGQRLPASYANFYIANKHVIVPTYNHPNDSKALSILQKLFPERQVVGLDATDLIWGLGAFHCLSQQQPA